MDDKPRRDEHGENGRHRRGSDTADPDQRGDERVKRDPKAKPPGLTDREREEQWPIG